MLFLFYQVKWTDIVEIMFCIHSRFQQYKIIKMDHETREL